MTLVSIIFSGFIVGDVAFIAGFVMVKQEGIALNGTKYMQFFLVCYVYCRVEGSTCMFIFCSLTNEQRTSIADYFRVYKVLKWL